MTDSNPEFDLTHEKSMVVDDAIAFVKSLNWDPKNLTETRDYAVATAHRHEVDEIIECFDADWSRQPFEPDERAHLIWCNTNGRDRIARFIDRRKALAVRAERALPGSGDHRATGARSAPRRASSTCMARPPHTLKRDKLVEGVGGLRILDDVGAKVHTLKHLKLHAKMMLADGSAPSSARSTWRRAASTAGASSRSKSTTSMWSSGCNEVAQHDWEHSHPLDLSDEGLLADLEKRAIDAASQLALNPDEKR